MQSKTFIKIWFFIVFVAIIFMGLVNYLIDPYGVFDVKVFDKTQRPNERVVKIDYLNAHKERYNAFMLGSSSIGTTDPRVLERYLPNRRFYNLTCSSSNLYDFKLLVKYLLEEGGFDVKDIYLQIDLTNMREYGKHNNHGQKHHYLLTGTPAWKFYLEYLTIFPFSALSEKIRLSTTENNATKFDIEGSGQWFVPHKDILRQKDIDTYVKNEHSFHKVARRTRGMEKNIDAIMADFKEIVSLCKAHDVRLTVLTTAYNHIRMDAFKIEDVLGFVKLLVGYHDIWYFSGYNSITNDDKNYYEVNHYIPEVGAMKAARIYHDRSIKVPEDFGTLVTKENLDTFITKECQVLKAGK